MRRRTSVGVAWSLGGQAAPLVIGIVTTPLVISRIGVDRFGLLSIGWMLVGYLSVFDFGIGRALTRHVSVKLGQGRSEEISGVFWSSILLLLGLSIVGASTGAILADWGANTVLSVPESLRHEAGTGFLALALGLPASILAPGLRGFIEAFQEFRLAGFIRLYSGLVTFLVPAIVSVWTPNLALILLFLVLARYVGTMGSFLMCLRVHPGLRSMRNARSRQDLKEIVTVGGWMTVSNIVSPLMSTMDRVYLGAVVSVAAVAYYATPADMLTRILIIPSAVTVVLFPTFSRAMHDKSLSIATLYERSFSTVFLVLYPIILLVVSYAGSGLRLWLGAGFAAESTEIVKWIAIGVLANGVALIPHSLLQSSGHSKSVAMLHLLELPIYLATVLILVSHFSIVGAAVAWTLRTIVDLIGLTLLARHELDFRFLPLAPDVLGLLIPLALVAFLPERHMLHTMTVGFALLWSCWKLLGSLLYEPAHVSTKGTGVAAE